MKEKWSGSSFEDLDWDLLHRQKMELLKVVDFLENFGETLLEGVVDMIDSMQDEAERQGLWSFPEETE